MTDILIMPGHQIRRLHQIASSLFLDQLKASGSDLTPVQFAALSVLARHPGIDQASLAAHIAYDRATIGGVVERLLTKDLIARSVSEKDRRARVLVLTDKGKSTLADATPVVENVQDQILAPLDSSEQGQFMELIAKLTHRAEPHN